MTPQIQRAAALIHECWSARPRVGVVLGTGLSSAVAQFEVEQVIPYARIPQFPQSTALSHKGQLVCGRLQGVPTLVMAGRCHLYEGYSFDEVTLPVRVMRALGAELLIVTNASGGLNPRFRGGEIMVLVDHINLLFRAGRRNPRGMAEDGPAVAAGWSGPSWGQVASERDLGVPASFAGYDADLVEETFRIARLENFVVHPGVYVAMIGPNYETRAEYRFLRRLGGDAVGMSTVPEVLTAVHLGMRVLALSVITNTARPDAPQRVEAQEVVDWAARAEPNLVKILHGIVARQEPAPKDSKHIRSS